MIIDLVTIGQGLHEFLDYIKRMLELQRQKKINEGEFVRQIINVLNQLRIRQNNILNNSRLIYIANMRRPEQGADGNDNESAEVFATRLQRYQTARQHAIDQLTNQNVIQAGRRNINSWN